MKLWMWMADGGREGVRAEVLTAEAGMLRSREERKRRGVGLWPARPWEIGNRLLSVPVH